MKKYVIRRLLQMIPTLFGVIVITFVLFNVVGGSPAAMVLGKHVSPKSLEEFDEQRGFNKPLLLGWWTTTRALAPQRFEAGPGAWKGVQGAAWSNGVLRLPPGRHALPLAFTPKAGASWRLSLEVRAADGASLELFPRVGKKSEKSSKGCHFVAGADASPSPLRSGWKKCEFFFQGLETFPELEVAGAGVELRAAELHRRMAHPLDSQLVFYLRQLARLDFGVSSSLNQPVARLLKAGIGPSLALTIPIFLVELALSIAMALFCAFFRGRWVDRWLVVLSVALMSINYLVWIVAGQYVLAYRLGWFPVWGFASWRYLILPVMIGVISGLGVNVRFYRTIMLDEMYKDYVRTALAKGVGRTALLFKHVLKNAMIPVVTNVVIALPFLYTGSLLLESYFGIPGLGYLGVNAINSRDVDVLRAVVFIGSLLFMAANLATDILYARLDPRVRLS